MSNIPIYYTEESVEKPWQLAFLFLGRLMIGGLQSPFDLFVQEIRDDCSNNNDCSSTYDVFEGGVDDCLNYICGNQNLQT